MMISEQLLSLKTDESLLAAVRHAAQRKPSAEEMFEQRVSFVYGAIGGAARKDGMTKDQVRKMIIDRDSGYALSK